MSKKRHVVIGFLTFCLTIAIFIGATTSTIPYDPWIDHNADGKINYEDLFALADHYGGEGTPINQAAVQFAGNTSVPAAAFTRQHDGYDWYNFGNRLHNYGNMEFSYWRAQVQLPHGANIIKLTSYFFDNNATPNYNVLCHLHRFNLTTGETVAGAVPPHVYDPGLTSYEGSVIHPTVDNNKYAYWMGVSVPRPHSDFYFKYAVIEWEYPTLP